MSSEEQNAMRGQAIMDLQDCRARLACMRGKASKLGSIVQRIGNVLLAGGEVKYAEVSDYPERQEVLGLAHGMATTRKQIKDLENELREMGVANP